MIFAHICVKNDKIGFSYIYYGAGVRVQQFHGKSQNVVRKIQVREILRNFYRWHAVMPLPLIAASDSFPILPLAIIFVNQRQGQYGTALFSGYHILPLPETMKNR